MTTNISPRAAIASKAAVAVRVVCTTSLVALAVAACRAGEPGAQVAGWTLVDPSQRHPILVSEKPTKMAVKVQRGARGLSPHQRSQVLSFLETYRANDRGTSRLTIATPQGTPNEVASSQAVAEIRYLMRESGFDDASIEVQPYHEDGDVQPSVRISYTRFVAEGPECGRFTHNFAEDPKNLPYSNLGCANQRNLAAQVANPADLLGPRQQTPAPTERRDTVWQKYVKGDSTVSQKSSQEEVKVKNAN